MYTRVRPQTLRRQETRLYTPKPIVVDNIAVAQLSGLKPTMLASSVQAAVACNQLHREFVLFICGVGCVAVSVLSAESLILSPSLISQGI